VDRNKDRQQDKQNQHPPQRENRNKDRHEKKLISVLSKIDVGVSKISLVNKNVKKVDDRMKALNLKIVNTNVGIKSMNVKLSRIDTNILKLTTLLSRNTFGGNKKKDNFNYMAEQIQNEMLREVELTNITLDKILTSVNKLGGIGGEKKGGLGLGSIVAMGTVLAGVVGGAISKFLSSLKITDLIKNLSKLLISGGKAAGLGLAAAGAGVAGAVAAGKSILKKDKSVDDLPDKKNKTGGRGSRGGAAAGKKALEKTVPKAAKKSLFKSLTKKVPVLGLIASSGFALDSLISGDTVGGVLEAVSGILPFAGAAIGSIIPGAGTAIGLAAGTAASFGLDYLNEKRKEKAQDNLVTTVEDNLIEIGEEIEENLDPTNMKDVPMMDQRWWKETFGKPGEVLYAAARNFVNDVQNMFGINGGALFDNLLKKNWLSADTWNEFFNDPDKFLKDLNTRGISSTGGNYIPNPKTGVGSVVPPKEIEDIIRNTSRAKGVDEDYMMTMGYIESGYRPDAHNQGSNAKGMYQFVGKTGRSYGLFGDDYFDPTKNTEAAARLTLDNMRYLKAHKIETTPENLYIAHQQGAYGLKRLIEASEGKRGVSQEMRDNMESNLPLHMRGKNITPAQFLEYWKNNYRQKSAMLQRHRESVMIADSINNDTSGNNLTPIPQVVGTGELQSSAIEKEYMAIVSNAQQPQQTMINTNVGGNNNNQVNRDIDSYSPFENPFLKSLLNPNFNRA